MTTERTVIQHLRALNPVLDEQALDLPDTSHTAFLDSLGRKPMSTETRPRVQAPRPQKEGRRNLVLALGARRYFVFDRYYLHDELLL